MRVNGDMLRCRVAAPSDRMHRAARIRQRGGQRLGIGDAHTGIGTPKLAQIEHRHHQRGGFRQVEVGSEPGVGDGVESARQFGIISENHARRRATKRLIGRAGHQVRALGQRLLKFPARDQARHMRGIVHQVCADRIGNRAHLGDRVGEQAHAAGDDDQFGAQARGIFAQRGQIDCHARGVVGHLVNIEAIQPGRARRVMRDMASGAVGKGHDRVAGTRTGHVGVQVRQRAAANAEFGVAAAKQLLQQFGRDDLDLLGVLHSHLVLRAGIAQAGPAADAGGEQARGAWVEDVGAGVEAQALAIHILLVAGEQADDFLLQRVRIECSVDGGALLNGAFKLGRHPWPRSVLYGHSKTLYRDTRRPTTDDRRTTIDDRRPNCSPRRHGGTEILGCRFEDCRFSVLRFLVLR